MTRLLRDAVLGERDVVIEVGNRLIGLDFDRSEGPNRVFEAVKTYFGPAPVVDVQPDFVVRLEEGKMPERFAGQAIEVARREELRRNDDGTWQMWSPKFASEWSKKSGTVTLAQGSPPHGASLALSALLHDVGRGDETVPLHAGLLATQSNAALLLGASGQGKSTTVSAAAQRGFTICSDDAVFVNTAGPRVLARCLPRTPMLPVESLGLSPSDRENIDGQLDYRQRLMADTLEVNTEWHELTAIVLVGHGNEPDSALVEVSRVTMARALISSVTARFNAESSMQALLDELVSLTRLPCYKLALGQNGERRPESAADRLCEILGTPSSGITN